jgi:hypothetical protein
MSERIAPLLATAALLLAPPAAATVQRTFVASYGLDTNACSLTAPCRTFTTALLQTNAGGEVVVLDSAGYGTFQVGGSVTITVPSGIYAGITVSGNYGTGAYVHGAGIDVTLRGLRFNAQPGTSTIGVWFAQGSTGTRLSIDGCTFSNFTAGGIETLGANGQLFVRDTEVVRTRNGIDLVNAVDAVLDGVRLFDNMYGLIVANEPTVALRNSVLHGNDTGVWVSTISAGNIRLTVDDTLVTDSTGAGFTVDRAQAGSTTDVVVRRSTVARNGGAGFALTAANGGKSTATIIDSLVTRNGGYGLSVQATAGGEATLIVDGSTVSWNVNPGIVAGAGTTLETRGNNTVEHNGAADVVGTPTPVAGK